MKKDLPYLNQERLDKIFERVYGFPERDDDLPFEDEKFKRFFLMLKSMQEFNYFHRQGDVHPLFGLLEERVFRFERNSEGTTLWLALILAIQELYGFSDEKLISVMKQVTVRK